jgi:hypothetical protein
MGRASVLGMLACLAACSTGPRPGEVAALGWSLGGEAHVFVTGDRFARALYRDLTGSGSLRDSLAARPLIAVEDRGGHVATVLSANGAAPGRMTLARFHAPEACGQDEAVTEMVFAFPPGGAAGHSTPPSHVTVVALVGGSPFVGGAGSPSPTLTRQRATELLTRVAQRAESVTGPRGEAPRAALLGALVLDPDRAADAGEVSPLPRYGTPPRNRYAVGVRARFVSLAETLLVTGVADVDPELQEVHWVVRPLRARLAGGMISPGGGKALRYSLRGAVAGPGGRPLLLLDEIAEVTPRDSRATAVDPATRRVIASQPLALRCP